MCGEAACAFRWSRLSHFSTTTKVSAPYLAPGPPSASIAGPYSMQPASAWTAGMLARKWPSTSSRLPGLAVMMAITWIMAIWPFAFDRVISLDKASRIGGGRSGGYRDHEDQRRAVFVDRRREPDRLARRRAIARSGGGRGRVVRQLRGGLGGGRRLSRAGPSPGGRARRHHSAA